MEEDKNKQQPQDEDAVMFYINPQMMQSLADVAAKKQEGFQEMLDAAEAGDQDAQYHLGMSYAVGDNGAPRDGEKAFYWFTKAAEGENQGAQYQLGRCWASSSSRTA